MAISRPYHDGNTHETVMALLDEETGKKHDPELMTVFRELIEQSELRAKG